MCKVEFRFVSIATQGCLQFLLQRQGFQSLKADLHHNLNAFFLNFIFITITEHIDSKAYLIFGIS